MRFDNIIIVCEKLKDVLSIDTIPVLNFVMSFTWLIFVIGTLNFLRKSWLLLITIVSMQSFKESIGSYVTS